jgi:uncharacterized membrane protein
MMNSNENSTMPLTDNKNFFSERRHRRLIFGLLALAPIGFLDSAYLTIEHYFNRTPPCSLISGCEIVTTSKYSVIFGVPTALMGALYYMAIILALVLYLDLKRDWIIKWTARFTAVGFIFSLWLVYLQLFVIKAICQYCMLSALSSTGLFVLGVLVLRSLRTFTMNNRQ